MDAVKPSSPSPFHSGFIAVVGRPNVGKSTLVNALVGEKIAIVSNKPQTTRSRIMGVVSSPEWQMVFLDTPGIHTPRTRLGDYMMKSVREALDGIDAILLLLDATHVGPHDRTIVQEMADKGLPLFIALNKIDLIQKDTLLSLMESLSQTSCQGLIPISALTSDGLPQLKEALVKVLPEGPRYFPEDMMTDQPERVICAELIREKALRHLREEVPHGIGVEIMGIQKVRDDLTEIHATIYCERDSHKGMIIGKGGTMLQRIGSEARREIETMLDTHVNLKLWVKIRTDWRNRLEDLRTLGYEDRQ